MKDKITQKSPVGNLMKNIRVEWLLYAEIKHYDWL